MFILAPAAGAMRCPVRIHAATLTQQCGHGLVRQLNLEHSVLPVPLSIAAAVEDPSKRRLDPSHPGRIEARAAKALMGERIHTIGGLINYFIRNQDPELKSYYQRKLSKM